MGKFAEARDGNEKEIIRALVKVGATVQKLTGGNGRPDLLVGYRGKEHAVNVGSMYLMEIKNPNSSSSNNAASVKAGDVVPGGKYHSLALIHGSKRVRRLNLKQAEWFLSWPGPRPHIVFTAREALDIIGAK